MQMVQGSVTGLYLPFYLLLSLHLPVSLLTNFHKFVQEPFLMTQGSLFSLYFIDVKITVTFLCIS